MKKNINNILMLLLGSFIYVIGINYFIVTANIFSGGLMGLAQEFAETINLFFDKGWTNTSSEYLFVQTLAYWALNLPAIGLGLSKVGKKFTTKTLVCSFIFIPFFINILVPQQSFVLDVNGQLTLASQVLSAIIGGVLTGAGMGIIFKYGGSSGGTDIVATYLALFKGKSFGLYNILINLIVMVWAILLYGTLHVAILLMILIYFQSKSIDYVYNFHDKVTLFVITTEEQKIHEYILTTPTRTYTKWQATLGYSRADASMLMVVVNREELKSATEILKSIDPHCFIDIVQTSSVEGNFENKFKSLL
ncbi:YitT family protein [Mollicutes bacterium LVI A0039]|nr:YitT family protein [Mollicutes bacterium LVI A0039]